MTPTQIELVQSSYRNVLLVSDSTAQLFYARLFAMDPQLKALFGEDIRQQGRMFMYALGAAVAWLGNFNAVVPQLEALAQRHRGYGVEPRHYAEFREALLWALERALGESFVEELRAAWRELVDEIAAVMKRAAYPEGA